jgi:HAD superfamily hydrolase (TIGR01549 family)
LIAILFDLEGTLVQSIESNQEAVVDFRVKTREKLVDLGVPSNMLKGETRSILMRNKAIEYVEKNFGYEEAKRFHAEMDNFLKSYELFWANRSKIFSDTIPTLRKLKKLGYKMGLVTSTSRDAANRILSIHRIGSFFDVIVTREDVKRLKPNPEAILLALKKLNEHNFFFVGDSIYDSQATERASGICLIVNRNVSKKLKVKTHYTVSSLTEIPSLIQKLVFLFKFSI